MSHQHQQAEAVAALTLLVATLLEDPAVRARIAEDPQLRALSDAAVQRHATPHAALEEGMAGLFEIVASLLAQPAVQATVEADPPLRRLWADPAVRQQLQQRGRH